MKGISTTANVFLLNQTHFPLQNLNKQKQIPKQIKSDYAQQKPVPKTPTIVNSQQKFQPVFMKDLNNFDPNRKFVLQKEQYVDEEQKERDQMEALVKKEQLLAHIFYQIMDQSHILDTHLDRFEYIKYNKKVELVKQLEALYAFSEPSYNNLSLKIEQLVFAPGEEKNIYAFQGEKVGEKIIDCFLEQDIIVLKQIYIEFCLAFVDGEIGKSLYDAYCKYFQRLNE
ncbi:Hypothetical_protein [Hexamita inflata]|uniref:Hypothetical_protein n=1 Tax=Hexamita inflata TaxID=28002 RepID=A0AA86P0M6_9EUKA|nr:Hypothetical protein HINF_LOCUS17329 [Hexamita inflata]